MNDYNYAGFWIRSGAGIIDTILIAFIIIPLLLVIYGEEVLLSEAIILGYWDVMLSYIFPAIAVIIFWAYKSATPGKILLNMKIVDEKTGGKLSIRQLVGRYFAYYISILPICLGIFWVGIDSRKQGWHDKLARTLVIRTTN